MRPIRFGQTVISCDTRYLSTLERMVYDAQFLRDYRGFNITTDNSDERMFRVTINPPSGEAENETLQEQLRQKEASLVELLVGNFNHKLYHNLGHDPRKHDSRLEEMGPEEANAFVKEFVLPQMYMNGRPWGMHVESDNPFLVGKTLNGAPDGMFTVGPLDP
ncbi:MAG: hypothetical protein IPK79_05080 [Vampirovibrionales bacterium]|nr:hypothetical protein [Vampirovibrionales bacterium]